MSWFWNKDKAPEETAPEEVLSSSGVSGLSDSFSPGVGSSLSLEDNQQDSAYTFEGGGSGRFDVDEDDDDDFVGGPKLGGEHDDSDFIDMTPGAGASYLSRGPMLDLGGLDGISPAALGMDGYGGYGGYGHIPGEFFELRRKGFSEQVTYLGGLAYLSGAATGGSMGLMSGLRASVGKPFKLRLNAVLNAAGKRGAFLANSMGVMALMFAISEHMLFNWTREEHPSNYAAAGAIAGAIFRSPKGLRAAGIWGAAGAAIGLGAVYASRQGVYGRELQGLL